VLKDFSRRQYSDDNCNEVRYRNTGVSQSYNIKKVSFTNSTDVQKHPPNSLPSDAMRKPSLNSLASDVMRKPPPKSLSSDATKNYYASCQTVDGIVLIELLLTILYLSKHHYHTMYLLWNCATIRTLLL